MSRAASAWFLALALCVFLLSWSFLHHGALHRSQIVDTPVYEGYGDAVMAGKIPYSDFKLEYPPAAVPVFVLPAIGREGDSVAYARWFDREAALCGCLALIGTALCLRALGAGPLRTALALLVFAVSPLLVGSVVLSRFDWWPAALAVLALAALLFEWIVPAAFLLAVAIAAKLWPAALVPIFAVWLARRQGARALRRWATTLAGVLAIVFVPFALIAPGGLGHSFHAQLARPLQLESLGSAVLLAVHHWSGSALRVQSSFGSQNVAGPGVHAVTLLTTLAGIAALVAVWIQFARGPATAVRVATSCAAAVAALLAFGKVFSPQFVVWLVPFVLLVPGVRGVASGCLLAVILVLTQSWFPRHYWALARELASTQSGELLARDLCVVALFVVLAWPPLQHEVLGKHGTRLEALQRVRPEVE